MKTDFAGAGLAFGRHVLRGAFVAYYFRPNLFVSIMNDEPQTLFQFQISFVLPGIATGLISKSPNSYFAGLRSSFEAFIAQSHFKARPV